MSEADEYPELYTRNNYEAQIINRELKSSPKREQGFMSKIFLSKKKRKKASALRSPLVHRIPVKKTSPRIVGRLQDAPETVYHHLFAGTPVAQHLRNPHLQNPHLQNPHLQIQYPVFVDNSPRGDSPEGIQEEEHRYIRRELNEQEKVLQEIRMNNAVLEMVRVEDRGTDPWDQRLMVDRGTNPWDQRLMVDQGTNPWDQRLVVDRGTDPVKPLACTLSICENERKMLRNRIQETEEAMTASFQEGCNLLEEVYKIKDIAFNETNSGQQTHRNDEKPSSANELIQISYKCLGEISIQLSSVQKQMQEKTQSMIDELTATKKESAGNKEKIKKLESYLSKTNKHGENNARLSTENSMLNDALAHSKKLQKDTDRIYKESVNRLEKELAFQKQSNVQLSKTMDEKTRCVAHLEKTVDRLRASIEETNQQISELNSSYKSKVAKLEQEHSNKISDLCENQSQTNKQLTQALDQSSKYVNLYQEVKKENVSLAAANQVHKEKLQAAQREMAVAVENSLAAERKLAREAKQVDSLREQLTRLSTEADQELLTVDGDLWCQIMKHHDQAVLDELASSLQEKEKTLEGLRAQGDCALKDFEKAQHDLQTRRQQFKELKGVLFDFERKRETVVREQREFYSKIKSLNKVHISKDTFFQNLIEECQTKSERIDELESVLKSTEKKIEETNKISEAQLKAMQMEMKYTAEKLYEFENQIQMKELHLQEVINVYEQEKRNKTTAEEAVHTYKIMLEDSKNENFELRSKLNYLEDLEKNRTNVVRAAENLTVETQKQVETESKLKCLEKELQDMKNQLQSGQHKTSVTNEVNMDLGELNSKTQELLEENKYLERILVESRLSKEALLKDQEELYRKLRHAVRVMLQSKGLQEELERKLDRRTSVIEQLEVSQLDTEERLQGLKNIVHEMKNTIDLLEEEREELQEELDNHSNCPAERALQHQLKVLQREKKLTEENISREKEILLSRLKENEGTMKDQHKHICAFQEQLDSLNKQLMDTKSLLVTERHKHTQQLLSAQFDKKKMAMYVKELEGRLAYEARVRMTSDTAGSSPHYLNSSDSYDPPHREHSKRQYCRK